MKKIFAILFSFQLILSPVVLAQDQECQSGEDCYQVSGNGSSEGAARYTNSIMMTGSGVVGSSLVFCTNTSGAFSHYIFMAGALVLLVSEINAAFKSKEARAEQEKQMERMALVNAKPGSTITDKFKDDQLVALKTAYDEEVKNRDALEQRMNWMTAVEVVYWLAVAGAAVEIVLSNIPPKTYNPIIQCNDTKNDKVLAAAIAAAYGFAANTGSGQIGGAALMGLSAASFTSMLLFMTNKVGTTLRKGATDPIGRSIVFGVFAALASIARDGLKKSRDRANKNIEKIEKSITEWKNASTVTTEIATNLDIPENEGGGTTGPNPSPIKQLPKAIKENKCMGSRGSSLEYSSKSCLNPLKLSKTKFDFKSSYLNSMGAKAFDMSDAMASGNADGARMLAADLASNAAKIKSEAKLAIQQADGRLKAEGKKTIDFEKEVRQQLNAISKDAQGALAAAGMKDLPATSSAAEEKKDDAPVVTKVESNEVPATAANPDLTIGSGDFPASEEMAAGASANPEQNLSDFETNEQDISKKNDVSLFKQLSNRYILNYTKIFERKKEPEVIQEPPKK